MLDLTQTLLVIVIVVLTALLSFIGVQVILILKDLRATIARANRLTDQLEALLDKFSHPAESLNNLLTGVKEGVKIVETVSALFKSRHQATPVYEDLP